MTYRVNSLASLYQLLRLGAGLFGERTALVDDATRCTYDELLREVTALAGGLAARGIGRLDRVAIFAPKDVAQIQLMLACNALGAVFVPINPQLKPPQVAHILADCAPALVVTTGHRAEALADQVRAQGAALLHTGELPRADIPAATMAAWGRAAVDGDPAAILYTSGSTGLAKGVVLSQRNLVSGALSVADYLELTAEDVVLGVLAISFDAGLSQVTTALAAGASYVAHEFLNAAQLRRQVARHRPTVITAVPPLWQRIADGGWAPGQGDSVRLVANTGGHMTGPLLARLRATFPRARPVLMYGLTESFRSTWLDPDELAARPGSMGRAVPNAQVMVVRPDGSECDADEPGELVHRGSFVSLGYLGKPAAAQGRFRPWPRRFAGIEREEVAVWSGDTVRRDRDGYLHFVGRNDEMIKVSGHRTSPTEVETVLAALEGIHEAVVFGIADERLGQAIVACIVADDAVEDAQLLRRCRQSMPPHMVPAHLVRCAALPRNANGKVDRTLLRRQWDAGRLVPGAATHARDAGVLP